MALKIRNKVTGAVRVIGVPGEQRVAMVCEDCGGYTGTPPFDSGTSATKYCNCWEPVFDKKLKKEE